MERIHSLFLLYRLEDSSCAFGAPLLQGPTHGAESLSFPFIPPRGSILRLWRAPSSRGYSWSGFTRFSFHSTSRIHPAPLAQSFSKGLLMEQSHSLFLLYRFEESILRLWRSSFPRAYSWSGFTRFSFHSASRIHPAPLARPFSKGLLIEQSHSLFLSFRLEDPSCAFGAALLQGPTHGAEFSLFLSFRFEDPSCAFGAAFLQGPTHGAEFSLFLLYRFEESSCAFGAPLLQGATQLAKLLSFT